MTTTTRKCLMFVLPAALFAATAATGCRSKAKDDPATQPIAAAPVQRATEDHPVIVRLVGRHYTVTASSGPSGVVYSADTADGRPIVANASLEEMRLRHPEIYQQILPGIATKGEAENTRSRETAEDASVDGPIPMGRVEQPATGMGARGEMLLMDARRE